jgi:hypothetical protein
MRVPRCALLALLLMSTAVLASPPDDFAVNDQAYYHAAPPQDTQLDGCVQLMERAFYQPDPANFDRAIDARHEMELARDAYRAGDEFACRRHAIHALEDRT